MIFPCEHEFGHHYLTFGLWKWCFRINEHQKTKFQIKINSLSIKTVPSLHHTVNRNPRQTSDRLKSKSFLRSACAGAENPIYTNNNNNKGTQNQTTKQTSWWIQNKKRKSENEVLTHDPNSKDPQTATKVLNRTMLTDSLPLLMSDSRASSSSSPSLAMLTPISPSSLLAIAAHRWRRRRVYIGRDGGVLSWIKA